MLKKISCAIIFFLILTMLSVPIIAAVFTDFDSYKSFNKGGNPVFNEGETANDYWIGEWNSGNLLDISRAAIEAGKGWNGTAALALWHEDEIINQGLYLYVTPSNGIPSDYTGMKYLRVWMDLTDVAFRKANFGVTDSHYNLFTTDEENPLVDEWPFYYLPDGGTTWQTMAHGGDGCFGDAQESDVYGFKGFFAFPVSDFVIRENEANHDDLPPGTPANMSDISGVYLFWAYSRDNTEYTRNQKFYIDNIEFVVDYKVFDGVIYNPPVPVVEESAEPDTSSGGTSESTPPAAQVTAPQTSDNLFIIIGAFILSTGFVLHKKRVI